MYTYTDADNSFLLHSMDIAIEADVNDDAVNSPIVKKFNFVKKIEQMIQKILLFIEEKMQRVRNNLKRVFETNYGFEKNLANAKKSHKPIENHIKVISYEYNSQVLELAEKAITDALKELIRPLTTFDSIKSGELKSPLLLGPKESTAFIITKATEALHISVDELMKDDKGDSVSNDANDADAADLTKDDAKVNNKEIGSNDNILRFFHYLKRSFHGKKAVRLVNGMDVKRYEDRLAQLNGIGNRVGTKIDNLRSDMRKLKTNLKSAAKNAGNDSELQKKLQKIISSLPGATNIVSSFYEYYYDLKIEEMFAAREIIKRVYQF